jgi:predicted Zn-dependent protease
LDTSFSEAYLGLGTTLNSAKRFADAIPPLQAYEKLAPDSPTGHYQLAFAYAGAGRRDDANREAALQRQTAEALEAVKRKAAVAQENAQQQAPSAQHPEPK